MYYLHAEPVRILSWFVLRWKMEVTFQEARRHLGLETQRQWSELAIRRTTPALLGLFSIRPTHNICDTWVYLAWQKERVVRPLSTRYLCGLRAIGRLLEVRFSAIVTPAIRRRVHESVWFSIVTLYAHQRMVQGSGALRQAAWYRK